MKHFVIISIDCNEAPMVGMIDNVIDDNIGAALFVERFKDAVCTYADIEDFEHDEIPNLFDGSAYHDVEVRLDGVEETLRIMETWIY
jgi:hypothetical protein